jgi:hypothetical protein
MSITSAASSTPSLRRHRCWRRGRHTVHYEFAYDGSQPGSGGISRLRIDGVQVGEARVPRTMPFLYSADEGVDVGTDNETPVTEDYKAGNNKFTGKIHQVTVEVKEEIAADASVAQRLRLEADDGQRTRGLLRQSYASAVPWARRASAQLSSHAGAWRSQGQPEKRGTPMQTYHTDNPHAGPGADARHQDNAWR